MADTESTPLLRPVRGREIVPVDPTDGEIVPVEERPTELLVVD